MHQLTVKEIIEPYLSHPMVIKRAILIATTHPSFSNLTKSNSTILKDLMTRLSTTRGEEPFDVNLSNISKEFNVSYKTVQRTIATLVEAGWMLKQKDNVRGERSNFGCFKSTQYQFTAVFCDLVRLPIEGIRSKPKGLDCATEVYYKQIDNWMKEME